MSLPAAPPTRAEAGLPLKKGSHGWPVYALQGALGAAGHVVPQDGDFGAATRSAVVAFQKEKGLGQDGRVGPITSGALVAVVCKKVDKSVPKVPDGLMVGMAQAEGGNNFGAVNPDVPGGVDCGLWQWRVVGPPYDFEALAFAFSPHRAGVKAARYFVQRRNSYLGKAWVGDSLERASRCAVMAHNWPHQGGADYIAVHGKCSNPSGQCSWVPRDASGLSRVRFPNGDRVETRWDWCCFYAGFETSRGVGPITAKVTSWR